MPLRKPRYRFVPRMVEGAPEDTGVYTLYRGSRVLYIGRAAEIRSRLRQHMSGEVCDCSRQATHYSWEIVAQPSARELELLQQQREAAGEWPPCNSHTA